jgi:virginiamycin B lyase
MTRKQTVLIVVLLLVIILGTSATFYYYVLAQPRVIVYDSMPEDSEYAVEYPTQSSISSPISIAVDSHGDVWFVADNLSSLVDLDPSTGVMREYKIPNSNSGVPNTWGMAIDSSRNLVWFTDQITNSVWCFNITSQSFKEYKLKTPNAFPFAIALDSKGDAWFTEIFSDKIGEITPSGILTEIVIPASGDLEPSGITVDSSGRVWFTLPGINSTGSYYDGKFQFQNLTGFVSGIALVGIAVDQNGNLWLTQHGPSYFSEYNPVTGYFRTISTVVPPSLGTSLPYFTYVDSSGDVWFNEHYGNAISEFIPRNNTLIEYYIPTRIAQPGNISGILTMNISQQGVPWFTEFFSGKVGTINTSAPLGLTMNLKNYSGGLITLGQKNEISLALEVASSSSASISLAGEVGNYTGNFTFTFSTRSQVGSFNSTVTILDNDSTPGIYFLTISAITSAIAYSKIVEVRVL